MRLPAKDLKFAPVASPRPTQLPSRQLSSPAPTLTPNGRPLPPFGGGRLHRPQAPTGLDHSTSNSAKWSL